MYFHINDINLGYFKKEITSIFRNDNPLYKYDFQLDHLYYIHLFQPNGFIIGSLSFKLLNIEDNEDIIGDLFLDILPLIGKYLKDLDEKELLEFSYYIGLCVNKQPENKIKPKELAFIKDKHLNDNLVIYHNFYINNILKV
jgi:hypothetical protein